MTSLRLAGLVLVSLLALTLAPSSALAQRIACDIADSGDRFCDGAITCDERRDCIGDPGSEDWFCLPRNRTLPEDRECMAACTTMFGCGEPSDCPFIGGAATCQPMEGSATSVCTYRAAAIPSRRITYCTDGGDLHVSIDRMAACHARPATAGMLSEFTPDYFAGDCDGDGCANGSDTDPCALPTAGGSCMATTEPGSSPFCPPLPPLACAPSADGVITCDDARPCTTEGANCEGSSTCAEGWSDGLRCRPDCSALFLCHVGALGPAAEQCPPFGGESGVCLTSPTAFRPYPGYDGVCVYPGFDDDSCTLESPTSACFLDPDGVFTTDLYRGDCDSDGIANGCDATRCLAAADEPLMCVEAPGAGCGVTMPLPDAGVEDAGVSMTDGGNTQDDAGAMGDASAAGDGGSTSNDAGTSGTDGGGTSFTGGGGCRCSAAGSDRGGRAGLGLGLIALASVLSRRRARR